MSINWSAINSDSPLGRFLRFPLRILPKGTVMKIRRGPAQGMKWIVGSSNHGCWLGTYEMEKQVALERFVKPGMSIYDIGAQAGFYTLFFSSLIGVGGKVYAFEPFAENVNYLVSHIRINGLGNVQVIQVALAEGTNIKGFATNRGKSQNTFVDNSTALLLVPTLTIDEVIEKNRFIPPKLMKIDVEGSEIEVLQGARRTFECYRPIIFVALHGNEQKKACQTFLEEVGYRIYDLAGNHLIGGSYSDEVYALPDGDSKELSCHG